MNDEWTIVTGGSQGIGAAVCQRMRKDGQRVLLLDIEDPKHEDLDEFLRVDLFEPQAAADLLAKTIGDRKITRLLHVAGICVPADLQHVTLENLQKELNVSTLSLIALSKVVVPVMEKHKWGRIVAFSSRSALGKAERTGYAAAKSALDGIIRSWVLEFRGNGVTVNAVSPGPTQTRMLGAYNSPDFVKKLAARVPLGFICDPEDMANAVAFLASDQARFITGQVLHVCGGTSIAYIGGV